MPGATQLPAQANTEVPRFARDDNSEISPRSQEPGLNVIVSVVWTETGRPFIV